MNKKLLLLLSIFIAPLVFAQARLNCNSYPPNSKSGPICETLNNINATQQYNFLQNFNNILAEKYNRVYSDLKSTHKRGGPSNGFGPAAVPPPQRVPQQAIPPVQTEPRNRLFY